MKQILFALLLTAFVPQGIFAQKIKINGTVKHAKNGETLEFVHAVLQTADSSFVAGAVTDSKGYFSLEAEVPGQYRLQVSSTGFVPLSLILHEVKEDVTLSDVLLEEETTALEGVTVSASNMSTRIDRKIIYPSERQQKASTNGVDLLQKLMLPRVTVNPLSNTVSIPGGGELQLRINGAKVEVEDVTALLPADIVRIEYHDSPGLRYGNAEVVLDYIVRRPETGGNLGIDLNDGLTDAWGNNFFNGRINHKRSEFSLNYGISHREFYQMWRDNEETYTFADGSTLRRREKGEPGHLALHWQNLNAKYSYMDENKMLNTTFRLYDYRLPHMDYTGLLYNVDHPADAVDMTDRTGVTETRPALDLYYQQSLPGDQTIVLNAVGTYNGTGSTRLYRESRQGVILTDVNNRVEGRKYSFIGEGIYEKKLGDRRLSAGIRHSQSLSDNTYLGGQRYETEMQQMETFVYGEFKGRLRKLDYTLSAGVTRSSFAQEGGEGYRYYTFNPRIVLFLPLAEQSSIRLRSDVSNSAPSLSNLSAVEQAIDSLQVMRGNPGLRPYLSYRTQLSYEYRKDRLYLNLQGSHDYHPRAIMEEKQLEGRKIIQTWNNQKDWQWLGASLNLRVGPLWNVFELSVTSQLNHYISRGNHYLHRYTNWYNNVEGNFLWKQFSLGGGIDTPWDRFHGETMDGGENLHYVMLGYRHKLLSVRLGMFNPFADNYYEISENRSAYASYRKTNYINESSRMIMLRLSYNFSFGRTFKAGEQRLHNADEDSGVMNTGK
ncbi:MAG: carboxypeptidase-like regulatory domain-containing protein [Tannerellaceae bacterium]|jgi:hypothetical protein|nr:carboxypeptidase-like regulatory domain-containing protein [Tannerellaceae bacterium]